MELIQGLRPLICHTGETQLSIRGSFLDLFEAVFGRRMNAAEWEHFYLQAPFGQTISFALYDADCMVAHGGLIPGRLLDTSGGVINYFLQTAVMVRKKYQTLVVFKSLLDWMSEYAREKGLFSMCFPNQASYLPFTKLLCWRMVQEYDICHFQSGDGSSEPDIRDFLPRAYRYHLPEEAPFMRWRNQLNHARKLTFGGISLIYKNYKGSMEILDLDLNRMSGRLRVNDMIGKLGFDSVNIPGCYIPACSLAGLVKRGTAGIPQRMCCFPVNYPACDYAEIKPSLLLSDVF